MTEIQTALCILFLLLAPLAAAGLALMNAGLGRSRNAAHSMISALCVMAVAACVYFVCGFAWQGFAGRAAHTLAVGGRPWSWIGAGPLFFGGLPLNGSPDSLAAWFGMLSVGLAALIPLGSGAERWRLGAVLASTVLLAGWTFPLFAHWAWGGGWLAQLGVNYGLGRGYVDAGGSGSIHAVGGLTALTIAWLLGPRRDKYSADGMPAAIPSHNAILVLFGCLIAYIGWLGIDSAGALLFAAAEPGRVALIAVNTTLGAGSAALAAVAVTRLRFGKPDASLTANGWVCGLVATSAGCAFFPPAAALIVGLAAGTLVTFSVELLELRLGGPERPGSISVHAVGGIWGVLAAGLFGRFPNGGSGQWLAQAAGVATLLGFVLPLTYGLNWLLNRGIPYRVALEGERQGMDLYELGAGAYPEFMVHTDEFTQRG